MLGEKYKNTPKKQRRGNRAPVPPRTPTGGAASPAPANQRPLATQRAERVRPVRMRGAGLRHFLPQDGGPLGGTDRGPVPYTGRAGARRPVRLRVAAAVGAGAGGVGGGRVPQAVAGAAEGDPAGALRAR